MIMNTKEAAGLVKPRGAERAFRFIEAGAIFFRGFLDHPNMVASVVPSSKSTITAMLEPVDWSQCRLFVEYGPGVGTFSTQILKLLPPEGTLLAIDTNPRFIDYLKETIDDARFHPVLGSAADVEKIVQEIGHHQTDYILSGLPFSALSPEQGQSIIKASFSALRDGGALMTYQFRPTARRHTEQWFQRVDTGIALWNVPPCLLTWGWKRL